MNQFTKIETDMTGAVWLATIFGGLILLVSAVAALVLRLPSFHPPV